uniref:Uncharacterized protein n=1 Tax=Arundo donax TaxID=35708 RepID=A0A0A9E7J6_ARUDO
MYSHCNPKKEKDSIFTHDSSTVLV